LALMVTTDTLSMATVDALARAFAVGLRRQLSPRVLAEIDATNVGSDDRCASLEWVDAHDIMDSAFTAVMRRGFNVDGDADIALWNAAWRRAREIGFAVLAREGGAP
jgi:hypothetical protein